VFFITLLHDFEKSFVGMIKRWLSRRFYVYVQIIKQNVCEPLSRLYQSSDFETASELPQSSQPSFRSVNLLLTALALPRALNSSCKHQAYIGLFTFYLRPTAV
jgi:hypothetical protein